MDNYSKQDDWQPCPSGELSRLTARLNSLQSAGRFKQVFGTGLLSMFLCAVATVILGGYVFYQEPSYAGFSCVECQAHAAEFRDFLVDKGATVDPAVVKKVKKHLKKCDGCRAKFKQKYPDAPLGPIASCESCLHQCVPKLSVGIPPAGF